MSGDGKKKRMTVIAVSSLVLVAMVVGVAVTVTRNNTTSSNKAAEPQITGSMKAIRAICQPTDFKETCEQSLSSANTTDPKELVKVGFQTAMTHITEAVKKSTTLRELEKDKFSAQALENCKELMDYAIDDLQKSFDELGAFDMSKMDDFLENIKIWLSAALTYQETCVDGFKNNTDSAAESMRKALKSAGEITRNGLAIVGEISTILTSLQIPFSRRLLSDEPKLTEDGFPLWASSEKRRLLALPKHLVKADVVVAKDGSGQYKTINDALKNIPPLKVRNSNPKVNNVTYVIHIKAGIYNEIVHVLKDMAHVMFMGDGPLKTKITGNKNFIDGTPTFTTATVAVVGSGFMARDIGFENSAGAAKHQAVALRVSSDMSVFYNCKMDAYQDTLYAHAGRQLYSNCVVSGTIDFIFGNAAVLFQKSTMVVRKPLDNQQNIVTAQGRKDSREPTGIVLQDCTIKADPSLVPFMVKNPSYLGRPWKEFSRTIIANTYIENVIRPEGWLPWAGDFGLKTCFYAEYKNKGPGSNLANRVKWPGIKTPTFTHEQALPFSADKFISAQSWLPRTGVPFIPSI